MAAPLREKGKDFEMTHSPMYLPSVFSDLFSHHLLLLLSLQITTEALVSLFFLALAEHISLRSLFLRCLYDWHLTFFGLYSICVFSCSLVSDSFMTPWIVSHQAPLSMGFPR